MFVMLKNKAYRRSGMHAIILIVFFCKWVSLFISHSERKRGKAWRDSVEMKWANRSEKENPFCSEVLLYAITQVCQMKIFRVSSLSLDRIYWKFWIYWKLFFGEKFCSKLSSSWRSYEFWVFCGI
jgi:hypothetical protein